MTGVQPDLKPLNVRWFFKDEEEQNWTPFSCFDSVNIEGAFLRSLQSNGSLHNGLSNNTRLLVRDGLFEANIVERQCYPVYWEGK